MIFNNPTDRPASYVSPESDVQSKLVRLVEDSTVEKTIRFDEMSISDRADPVNTEGGNKKENELGLMYPIIRINDWIFPRMNIAKMSVSSIGLIPTISLTLIFDDTMFINKNTPKDGDIISLYLRSSSSNLSYLRDDFVITQCSSTIKEGSTTRVSLSGKLFIPDFDAQNTTDVYTGTTKNVVRQFAMRYGLGFAYNDFDDTEDYQNWIKCNESGESFMTDMTKHIWKDETSFFKTWIDLYYNMCIVNVNKFLLTSENEEEVDFIFATNSMNDFNITGKQSEEDKNKIAVKILTNVTYFKGTPFYIKSWKPINNSSSISFNEGYSVDTYTFIHNQDIINSDKEGCFVKLSNIPAYDKNKTDSHIILRGRAKYDKNLNPEGEMERVNYDYVNTYIRNAWTGVDYVLADDDKHKRSSNQWSGNVHKNYGRAVYHNNINLNEINKIYLKVVCEGLCLQVMRGERIPVYLVYENALDESRNAKFNKDDIKTSSIRFYTGYYYVDSVEYEYKPINDSINPFSTIFILKRREWPTPEAI